MCVAPGATRGCGSLEQNPGRVQQLQQMGLTENAGNQTSKNLTSGIDAINSLWKNIHSNPVSSCLQQLFLQ